MIRIIDDAIPLPHQERLKRIVTDPMLPWYYNEDTIESQKDDKVDSPSDEQQSGKYLILHLCHHFDTLRSFTSLTLVRDSYGVRRSKD